MAYEVLRHLGIDEKEVDRLARKHAHFVREFTCRIVAFPSKADLAQWMADYYNQLSNDEKIFFMVSIQPALIAHVDSTLERAMKEKDKGDL